MVMSEKEKTNEPLDLGGRTRLAMEQVRKAKQSLEIAGAAVENEKLKFKAAKKAFKAAKKKAKNAGEKLSAVQKVLKALLKKNKSKQKAPKA